MNILKFFREDFGEILGVYCDEEKIFLARLTDKIETAEINFEIDLNNKTPAIFQFAEKIKIACSQRDRKIRRKFFIQNLKFVRISDEHFKFFS